jgi:hypothetical protein
MSSLEDRIAAAKQAAAERAAENAGYPPTLNDDEHRPHDGALYEVLGRRSLTGFKSPTEKLVLADLSTGEEVELLSKVTALRDAFESEDPRPGDTVYVQFIEEREIRGGAQRYQDWVLFCEARSGDSASEGGDDLDERFGAEAPWEES